jgi:hypothetical protein
VEASRANLDKVTTEAEEVMETLLQINTIIKEVILVVVAMEATSITSITRK